MKKVLALYSHRNAVYFYRMFNPLDHVKNKVIYRDYIIKPDEKVRMDELEKRFSKMGSIWIVKYLPTPEAIATIVSLRKLNEKRGGKAKLIVDIDDNIWGIPRENPVRKFWSFERVEGTNYLLSEADHVTVATEPLRDMALRYNKNVSIIANMIDPDMWGKPKKHIPGKTKIFWSYSPTHAGDIPVIKKTLEKLKKKYKDQIEIVIMGKVPKRILKVDYARIPGVIHHEYPAKLKEIAPDISIGPLRLDQFNVCKSNIKWLEATMAGSAFVGSYLYPYTASVNDWEDGMLAKDSKEWFEKLSILIEEPRKRADMVKKARKRVMSEFNIHTGAVAYEELFKSL